MRRNLSIRIDGLHVGYNADPVLSGVTLDIAGGEFVGIVGPNGSGKTTLLRSIARILRPNKGTILIDDRDVFSIPAKELARDVGVVPQDTVPAFDFTALDIVLMGRSPHLGRFQTEDAKDLSIAEQAMRQTGTLEFANRSFATLSGGERQRVVIARALAQEPRVILLDEPTSHLDINYQYEILNLILHLNKEHGLTVLAVLHDLNLASGYSGKLVMLGEGRIQAMGTPSEVLTAENVKRVYGVEVWVRKHPTSGRPYIIAGIGRSISESKDKSFEHRPKVHVICGGGTGAPIFARLLRREYEVTAGVLNVGDTDQEAADALDIRYLCAPPFTPIPRETAIDNKRLAHEADVVVVSDAPFGAWNLLNLQTAESAVEGGKHVVFMRPETIKQRDFTDGNATQIMEQLMPAAKSASTLDELMSAVESSLIAMEK